MKNWVEVSPDMFQIIQTCASQWREARVLLGGNNLWTAYVNQFQVMLTKRGKISSNPKLIKMEMMKPQSKTKEQAMRWSEEVWCHFPALTP